MKAVSQSPQRNARFAKSVCNAAGPTAKITFYLQPLIGIIKLKTIGSFSDLSVVEDLLYQGAWLSKPIDF